MGLYSYTRLATYKQCPYKYKLRYIDKIPEVKTIEQFMGSTVHKTLEKLYKNVISAKLIPLEKILEYYQKRWARYWHDNIKFVKKDFTKDDYKALGEKCIEDYYKNYYPFNNQRLFM